MTLVDDFKCAFLRSCADQGLTPAEALQRAREAVRFIEAEDDELLKQANPAATAAGSGIGSFLGGLGRTIFVDTPKSILSQATPTMLGLAAILGLGVPLAAGVAGGKALAATTEDSTNIEEAKARELTAEYQRQIDKIKHREALRRLAGVGA